MPQLRTRHQHNLYLNMNNNYKMQDNNEMMSKSIHIHRPGGLTSSTSAALRLGRDYDVDLSKNDSCNDASSFAFAKSAPVAIPRPHLRKMIDHQVLLNLNIYFKYIYFKLNFK